MIRKFLKNKIKLKSIRNIFNLISYKLIFIITFVLTTFIPFIVSFADDVNDYINPNNLPVKEASPEITKILLKFSDYLTFNGITEDVLQVLKYKILKGLYYLANGAYKGYRAIFDLNTYFDSDKINSAYKIVFPAILFFLVISFMYIGYRMILQKKDDRVGFISNLILAVCLIIILPASLITLNTITKIGFDMVDSINTGGMSRQERSILNEKIRDESGKTLDNDISPVDNVYKILFIDVQRLSDDGFKKDVDLESPNNLTIKELENLNVKKLVKNENEILKYILDGNKAEAINWSLFSNPGYYRWSILFWQGVAYLLLIIYVYVICGVKQGGVIFNLAIIKIIGSLFIASDIHSGEKTKGVIKEVLNSYAMLLGMHFLVTIFSFYIIWISSLKVSVYVKLILLYGSAVAVVGAGIYERILGIQGIGSRFNPLQTLYQLKMLSGGIFRKISHNPITKNVSKGIKNVADNTFSKNSPYFNKDNLKSNNSSFGSSNLNKDSSTKNQNSNNNSTINITKDNLNSKRNFKNFSETKKTKQTTDRNTRSSMFNKNNNQRNDNLRR